MNKIQYFFKKRKQEKIYKKYLLEHKKNIMRAFYELLGCRKLSWIMNNDDILLNLWYRVLDHDDSKYSKEEFNAYRKNYCPVNLEEKKNNLKAFEKAQQQHWDINDHHWQHRITWKDEDFNIKTVLACLENVIDWLAVGYKFNNRPYEYYEKHKDEITLPKKQKDFIEKIIYEGIDEKYIKLRKEKSL